MGQDRILSGKEFRLDKEATEGWMSRVGLWGVENYFRVAGQFDLTRALRIISQGNPTHLRVILRRDEDLHVSYDACVAAPEVCFVFREGNFIRLRRLEDRLMTRRPYGAASHVAQVNKCSPVVSSDVFPPAGDRICAAVGITGARGRDHDVVSSI